MFNFTRSFVFKKQILQFVLPVAVLLVSSFQLAKAEGSRDLYPAGVSSAGYRSFLLARGIGKSSEAFDPYPNAGVMRVYAKSGEVIYLGSSMIGKKAPDRTAIGSVELRSYWSATPLTLERWDGTAWVSYTASTSHTSGQIQSRSQELAGPRTHTTGENSSGYSPIRYVVPEGRDGIYEVSFINIVGTSSNAGTNLPSATYHFASNADWTSVGQPLPISGAVAGVDPSALILAWDVSVFNNGNYIKGRLFTNVLNLTGPNSKFNENSFYAKFIILTKSGYSYTMNTGGLNGASFNFFSNNKGIRSSSTVSSPASYSSESYTNFSTISPKVWDPRVLDDSTNNNITNKIFYNTPDPTLPSYAPAFFSGTASGGTAINNLWLLPEKITPEITRLKIECGGLITFRSNLVGTYRILIDANNNGNYNEDVDRVIYGEAVSGNNTYLWDRKNGSGTLLANNTNVSIKVQLTTGEVHFPLVDLESNNTGFSIEKNDDNFLPTSDNIIYWNDNSISVPTSGTGSNKLASNPQINIKEGTASISTGNPIGHSWGSKNNSSGEGEQFGNNALIDTWTFIKSEEVGTTSTCVAAYGNVWHDTNGANNIDSSGGKIIPANLYVALLNNSNVVQQVTTVNPDGTYSFTGLSNASYKVRLLTTSPSIGANNPTATVPVGWTRVGEATALTGNDNSADGTISFTVSGNASVINLNFGIRATPVTVSGTVYNDVNGNATKEGSESGTNAGGLTAYLVYFDGYDSVVVNTATVNANGTYSFSNVYPGLSYSVIISESTTAVYGDLMPANTLPNDYLYTSSSTVTVTPAAGVNVTGVDFGIDNKPVAIPENPEKQPNPGIDAFVDITNNFSGNDSNGGYITAMTITEFPDNANSLNVGNTTYYKDELPAGCSNCALFPEGGITISFVDGRPSQAIQISPKEGDIIVNIPFTVTDNAGLVSDEKTLNVEFEGVYTISGSVFNDNNGTVNNADGQGLENVVVNLYAADGITLIATTTTNENGEYSFDGLVDNTYIVKVVLPTAAEDENDYQHVSAGAGDATPTNGETTIVVNGSSTSGVNFGINQGPVANDNSQSATKGSVVTFTDITANDSDFANGSIVPSTINLIAPNGVVVTSFEMVEGRYKKLEIDGEGVWEVNNDGQLTFTPAEGFFSNPTPITYTVEDNAGLESNEATITITYESSLPVTLTSFQVAKQNNQVLISWATASEQNNKGFYVQRSNDGIQWEAIEFVPSKANNGNSQAILKYQTVDATPANGTNYYRLQQVDIDGKASLSAVQQVNFNQVSVRISPNPVKDMATITGLTVGDKVKVISMNGAVQYATVASQTTLRIDFKAYSQGAYIVLIEDKAGNVQPFKIVK